MTQIGRGLRCIIRPVRSWQAPSLMSPDRLLGHVHQPVLGFAFWEVRNGSHGLLRVFLRQSSCLLYAVALQHYLASLCLLADRV